MRSQTIYKDEFLSDIQNMDAEEFPDVLSHFVQGLVGEMEAKMADGQAEIAMSDFFGVMLDAVFSTAEKVHFL